MRSTAVQTLVELADGGLDVHLLTADLGFRVLDPFRERHPDRFTNVGVSEANMISVAVGMSLEGKRPVCYSMVPFLFMRAFEQVRLDVVAHRSNVVLFGVGGGLSYGHEGISHHAIEDLAIARSLPGLRVLAPGDPMEVAAALRTALREGGPTFIRVGQNNDPIVHKRPIDDLRRPILVRPGSNKIVVLAVGHILSTAVEACERIGATVNPTLFSVPAIKPFDVQALREIATGADLIVTIEEHSIIGGLGSLVADHLLEARFGGQLLKVGLPDAYCDTHASLKWLRAHYGLDAESIARKIAERIG